MKNMAFVRFFLGHAVYEVDVEVAFPSYVYGSDQNKCKRKYIIYSSQSVSVTCHFSSPIRPDNRGFQKCQYVILTSPIIVRKLTSAVSLF